ncbi:hypothetical protein [Paenibacillus fonticola]|nr:hypothetical protein [Paenibacillus fonticola]
MLSRNHDGEFYQGEQGYEQREDIDGKLWYKVTLLMVKLAGLAAKL